MELEQLHVDTQPSLTLPHQEMLLMPIGDVQLGAKGVLKDRVKRHVNWGLEHGAYFLGMGDYIDVMSPSNRAAWRSAPLYDSVREAMAEKAQELGEEFLKLVDGSQDRWLGILEGHHYFEFTEDDTTDTRIAEALNAPFLETTTIIELKFGSPDHTRIKAQIWATHGQGSGQTMAAPLNKLERVMSRFPSVDVFLVGHYSRKVGYPVDAKIPKFGKHPRLVTTRRILGCTGGFLDGYATSPRDGKRHKGSYVEKGMMAPLNLGGLLIRIRPVHEEWGDRLDMSVEA